MKRSKYRFRKVNSKSILRQLDSIVHHEGVYACGGGGGSKLTFMENLLVKRWYSLIKSAWIHRYIMTCSDFNIDCCFLKLYMFRTYSIFHSFVYILVILIHTIWILICVIRFFIHINNPLFFQLYLMRLFIKMFSLYDNSYYMAFS